jgi:hypothetical protein
MASHYHPEENVFTQARRNGREMEKITHFTVCVYHPVLLRLLS